MKVMGMNLPQVIIVNVGVPILHLNFQGKQTISLLLDKLTLYKLSLYFLTV